MRERPAVWAGLLVAFLGLLPLVRSSDPEPQTDVPVPIVIPDPTTPTAPSIVAVDPSVSKILDAAGSVTVVGESDLPGVAPEIVRVLMSFDVPLLVPVETQIEAAP